MKLTAYETTLLKSRKMDKVIEEARQSIILRTATLIHEGEIGDVYAIVDKHTIEPFNYPLVLEMSQRKPIALIDLRLHNRGVKKDPRSGELEILEYTTAEALVQSATLALKWRFGNSSQLMSFNQLPMIIYSQWISESITRKLGLPPDAQVYLTVLFAAFYFNLNKPDGITDMEKQRFSILLARHFKISDGHLTSVLDRLTKEDLSSLLNLVRFIQQDRFNVRLDNLQLKDIYTLLNSSWFGGPNAREQVDVAIEYPPVFLPMVYHAVTNRSYSKTALSQIYQRYQRSHRPDEFKRDFLRLVSY